MQPRNQQVILLKGGGERLLGDMLGLLSAALAGASQVSSSYLFSKCLDSQNHHFLEIKTCRLPQLILSATSTHLSFLGCSGFVARSSLLYKWDFHLHFFSREISKLTFHSFENFTFRISPFMFFFENMESWFPKCKKVTQKFWTSILLKWRSCCQMHFVQIYLEDLSPSLINRCPHDILPW